jgi:hypothetical protein
MCVCALFLFSLDRTPKILQLLLEDPEWKRLQRLVTEKRNVHSRRSGELNAQWFDAIEEERPKWVRVVIALVVNLTSKNFDILHVGLGF